MTFRKGPIWAAVALSAAAVVVPLTGTAASAAPLPSVTAGSEQITTARTVVTAHAVRAVVYTVRAGDSISGVSLAQCGTEKDWTGIYAASRKAHLTARNANTLVAGQKLAIQCYENPGMAGRAWTPPPPVQVAAVQAAPVQQAAYQAPVQKNYQAPATYQGSGSMQQCIISRESGGNSQVMNSSGHYGLYQFSASTWAAHGGNPADFGNASVSEQNAVYQATVAADGYSDWSPYDGC